MNRQLFQQRVIERAVSASLEEAEAYSEFGETLSIKVYDGEVETYSLADEGGVSLRAVVDGKMGYAYTEKLEEQSIDFLISNVRQNAHVIDEAVTVPIFGGSEHYEKADFYESALNEVEVDSLIDRLIDLERYVYTLDDRIVRVNQCGAQIFEAERSLTNTNGLALHERSNGFYVYVSVLVSNDEEKKTGYAMRLTRDIHSVDWNELAREAVREATESLGSRSIPSKKYKVLLRNDAATSLFKVFLSALSAEEVVRGTSRLKDQVGEIIASPALTMIDDPSHAPTLSETTFDAEGVATKRRTIIERGRLKTFFHNRETAKALHVETTGHAYKPSYKGKLMVAPHHLIIASGDVTREECIERLTDGVYITSLAGLHSGANATTGDFSVAASGFYVENGTIAFPLRQMTIAGNFFDSLHDIEAIATDRYDGFGRLSMPSVLLRQLAVTIEQ